jgi:hypothetical protein
VGAGGTDAAAPATSGSRLALPRGRQPAQLGQRRIDAAAPAGGHRALITHAGVLPLRTGRDISSQAQTDGPGY